MSLIVAPFCEVAMDTLYYFHRWLLWIALIVLLYQCQDVSGTRRECPQGQLIQHQIKHRRQYITCCYPTRCAVGERVEPCAVNGTHDTCIPCNPHYNQSQRTSSFTMEACIYWPLDAGCKTVNHNFDITDWRTKRCMCNIERGMKFDPPEAMSPGAPADAYCQRMRKPCLPGHEPTVDGDCVPCKDGFFKSEEGFRLCEPKTNCSLLGLDYVHESNATGDNVCSEPEPVTTPKPIVTEKPTSAVVHPKLPAEGEDKPQATTASTTESSDAVRTGWSRSSEDGDEDREDPTWPIIVTVVIFLIIVVVAISGVLFYRKRKGKAMCLCATTNNCTDLEKSPQNDHPNKFVMANGGTGQQYITGGDKVTNNNVNGGLPATFVPAPSAHLNGDVPHRFASSSDPGNRGGQPYYHTSNEFYPAPGHPQTNRSGILGRPSNAVYAQNRGNVSDKSIDSIGQEKLKVNVAGLEANQALDENDPLLVAEAPRGAAALHDMQFQNLASSVNNSPPVMPPNINPTYILTTGAPVANFINSGPSSPPVQPQGTTPQVTFAPGAGAATFTRSTSVIASPEGEVDEDEIEARVPRFSQLLPDTEDTSGVEANANARAVLDRDPFRADSPARESTQQLRAPSQRLMRTQCQPAAGTNNNNMPLQQQRRQGAQPPQQQHRPGHTPAVVGPVTHGRDPHQSDHCIMNLKEQELAESSTSNSSSLDSQQKHPSDLSETDALKTLNPSPGQTQQTELKTQVSPIIDSDFSNNGASAHVKTAKAEDMDETFPHTTEPKLLDIRDPCPTQTERKRQGSGGNAGQQGDRKRFPSGNNVQNVRDRKRAPSGGSNSSAQNTLERRKTPSGDQQKPCIKSSSVDESDSASKKQRYNRTVSFEEDETSQTGSKQRVHTTEPWQSATSDDNTSEKRLVDPRYRGPFRSVSDPEQKNSSQDASDEEERKCASLEYNASTSSSKNSVNSDRSGGGDSNHSCPSRTALYRRSQSENASSNESPHKPPPRSMSEEKPQKMDRPIAKVKPMPASDNTVNQTPVEVSDSPTGVTSTQQQPIATVVGSHTNGNNILNYSSDESDLEHDVEGNITTSTALDAGDEREEINTRRSEEQESRESGSR